MINPGGYEVYKEMLAMNTAAADIMEQGRDKKALDVIHEADLMLRALALKSRDERVIKRYKAFKQLKEHLIDHPAMLVEAEDAKDNGTDVEAVIKELIDTSWGGDNNSQGKAVQLLKGLAFSDDPKSNEFMKKLDKFTSGLGKKNESEDMYEESESDKNSAVKKIVSVFSRKFKKHLGKVVVVDKGSETLVTFNIKPGLKVSSSSGPDSVNYVALEMLAKKALPKNKIMAYIDSSGTDVETLNVSIKESTFFDLDEAKAKAENALPAKFVVVDTAKAKLITDGPVNAKTIKDKNRELTLDKSGNFSIGSTMFGSIDLARFKSIQDIEKVLGLKRVKSQNESVGGRLRNSLLLEVKEKPTKDSLTVKAAKQIEKEIKDRGFGSDYKVRAMEDLTKKSGLNYTQYYVAISRVGSKRVSTVEIWMLDHNTGKKKSLKELSVFMRDIKKVKKNDEDAMDDFYDDGDWEDVRFKGLDKALDKEGFFS